MKHSYVVSKLKEKRINYYNINNNFIAQYKGNEMKWEKEGDDKVKKGLFIIKKKHTPILDYCYSVKEAICYLTYIMENK